ncbi:DUF945 family protein [Orrella sp. JC864]|uniref:DUF945 family protein n=1 Tax=Orrella sp. JC864 TaxID=3120298 RepID=UPI003008C3AF
MKKSTAVVSALALAALAYAGASWHLGKRIQARTAQALEQAHAALQNHGMQGLTLALQTESYARGWFNSRARYVFSYERQPTQPDEQALAGRLVIENRIAHGPLAPSALARGQFVPGLAHIETVLVNEAQARALFELTGQDKPLRGLTRIGFDGASHGDWTLAAFQAQRDGRSVSFSGARLSGMVAADLQRVAASGVMDHLLYEAPGQAAEIRGLRVGANTRAGALGMGVGDSSLNLGLVRVQAPGAAPVVLEKLSHRLSVSESGSSVAVDATYAVDRITVRERDFGNMQMALQIGNLDGAALQAFSARYDALLRESAQADGPSTATYEAFEQAVDGLLAGKPTVAIEPWLWRMPQGESRLSVKAGLRERTPPADQTSALPALHLLERLDLDLSVAKPMLQEIVAATLQDQDGRDPQAAAAMAQTQVQAMADAAQLTGLVTAQGDRLSMTLAYADGRLQVNGQEQPIQDLAPGLGLAVPGLQEEPAGPAFGQVLQSLDPKHIAALFEEEGYEVARSRDAAGEPLLEIRRRDGQALRGREIQVEFYGCIGQDDCEELLLRAIHDAGPHVTLTRLNAWNADSRWVKAYQSEDGQAVLEMDIGAYGGLGQENLASLIVTFVDLSEEFAEFIGAQEAPVPGQAEAEAGPGTAPQPRQ